MYYKKPMTKKQVEKKYKDFGKLLGVRKINRIDVYPDNKITVEFKNKQICSFSGPLVERWLKENGARYEQ